MNIKSILLTLCLTIVITGCTDDDRHDGERGLALSLDNSVVSDVPIGETNIYVYDTEGKLYSSYKYTDAYTLAQTLLPLEQGQYTIVTVINSASAPSDTESLTSLHECLLNTTSSDLLSGISYADVTKEGVTSVTLPIQKDSFPLPTLSVHFTLPESSISYIPHASASGYSLRCIAELRKDDTGQLVLRKPFTPKSNEDGTYSVALQIPKGNYSLHLWTDYAHTSAPLSDTHYNTSSLNSVSILSSPYTANTDAKDAAYGNKNGITLSEESTTVTLALQRPLGKYRIIVDAEEISEYQKLNSTNPQDFPAISDLTVSVDYEGYFPSGFNVSTSKPNDALTGLFYSRSLASYDVSASEIELCSDWIFVNGTSSFVNVTVTLSDSNGNVICRVPGVQINCRRNELTTISGKFLTSSANSGGIKINTEWEESNFDMWF